VTILLAAINVAAWLAVPPLADPVRWREAYLTYGLSRWHGVQWSHLDGACVRLHHRSD
jgi:hypothetical protein